MKKSVVFLMLGLAGLAVATNCTNLQGEVQFEEDTNILPGGAGAWTKPGPCDPLNPNYWYYREQDKQTFANGIWYANPSWSYKQCTNAGGSLNFPVDDPSTCIKQTGG